MRQLTLLFVLFIMAISPANGQPVDLQAQWDDGFQLVSEGGDYSLGIGANIQVDRGGTLPLTTFPETIDTGQNRMLLRRARLYMKGVLHDHIKYKVQFEFAEGNVAMKDVFLTIRHILGIRNMTIGHFKEPFLQDYLSSSKTLMFLSRALPVNMAPKRNAGVMFHRSIFDPRLKWYGGVFTAVGELFNTTSVGSNLSITNRVVGLPLWQDEGKHLLHIGASYSLRQPPNGDVDITVSPESAMPGNYLTPPTFSPVSQQHLIGGELTWHYGAFTIQGEYTEARAIASRQKIGSLPIRSYHGQLSWMINGQRQYDPGAMTLDKVNVDNSLMDKEGGKGALELAARFSAFHLPGWPYNYQSLKNLTVGINWYLTPGIKMAGNYTLARLAGDGQSNIVQFRFQLSY
ncbi:MAG: hypothetical protein BRD50_05720 [Bacteroidetes bacterium SW_11_45_7]|nr:MAG: hypothetical protein BRD50_05720 [Bacteroidetes bacterium SW_11_45_7]